MLPRAAAIPFRPWPAALAFAIAFGMLAGLAFMHPGSLGPALSAAIRSMGWAFVLFGLVPLVIAIGAFALSVVSSPTPAEPQASLFGARTGVMLFILSEAMLFAGFFAAYFYFAAGPVFLGEGRWPPPGIEPPDPWGMAAVNTAVLFTSGLAAVIAHHAFLSAQARAAEAMLAIAIVLGLVFLGSQVNEFIHAPFTYHDGVYASVFFIGTGFHGLHVFVGVVLLTIALLRLRAGHFTLQSHFGMDAPIWYWHFVDIVWLFLFGLFYW